MTHFSTVFSALHDWFQQFQWRPCGRQVGFCHCPAIVLTILSWVVALNKAHCFRALLSETVQSIDVFMLPETVCH